MDKKDNRRLDYGGLIRLVEDFKTWVLALFSRAHARMGHIEEEIYKVRQEQANDYWLEKTSIIGNIITYALVERTSGENHGTIQIDSSTGQMADCWIEDINVEPGSQDIDVDSVED